MVSWVALRLACICGSATLAMVVSSTCRSTAIITPMVTISRSPAGSGCVATSGALAMRLLLAGIEIDGRGHRQAGDHRAGWHSVEHDPHRHALRHLDPVAVGVLRREQRELASGARADALQVALELLARIGIDLHGGVLARNHSADILLLEVCLDPGALAVDEREHTESSYRHLADLKVVGILDHAVH